MTPVIPEPLLGYHPCSIGFLTSRRDPAVGQCQTGSLTGAVASERVSEAPKGSLRMDGNHSQSAKAEGSLTATPTGGAGTKVGLSDPVVLKMCIRDRIISSYGVELRKQNIPIRQTLEIYRSAVSYLIGIYVQVWERCV